MPNGISSEVGFAERGTADAIPLILAATSSSSRQTRFAGLCRDCSYHKE